MSFIKNCIKKILGIKNYSDEEMNQKIISEIREGGGSVGDNVDIIGSSIDMGEPYFISIGNNVTLSGVKLLTHDGSTKKILGYSKTGHVHIGNDVFIGWGSIILPDTTIGNKVIIGAGSVVAKDIPDNVVVAGNPVRVLCSYDEYVEKCRKRMEDRPVVDLLPNEIMNDPDVIKSLVNSGNGYIL